MSTVELGTKPPNTTLSPYSFSEETGAGNGSIKRSGDSDSQYWRYDVSQKRQKHGDGIGDRLCFKFVSSGSCARENCHFRHDEDAREQSRRGVCFDFLNKGQCERGPDCTFKHSLQEEGKGLPSRRSGSGTGSSNRLNINHCLIGVNCTRPPHDLERCMKYSRHLEIARNSPVIY